MSELRELVSAAAVDAATDGEQVEAYAEEERRTEVSALRGEVEGMTFAESRGVGVRVIRDERLGYAWAADPTEDEVRAAVAARAAERRARRARPFERVARRGRRRADARAVPRRERSDHRRRQGRGWRSTSSGTRSRATHA